MLARLRLGTAILAFKANRLDLLERVRALIIHSIIDNALHYFVRATDTHLASL